MEDKALRDTHPLYAEWCREDRECHEEERDQREDEWRDYKDGECEIDRSREFWEDERNANPDMTGYREEDI